LRHGAESGALRGLRDRLLPGLPDRGARAQGPAPVAPAAVIHGAAGFGVRHGMGSIGTMLEPGQEAPDFELPDQDGRPVKLSDFRGQPVVVYFYPKADTPGCTAQACGVRDHHADYAGAGAVVLGISPDPVTKLKRFEEKQ